MRSVRARLSIRTVRSIGCALVLAVAFTRCGDPVTPTQSAHGYRSNGARADGTHDHTARPNLIVIVVDTLRGDALETHMPKLQARATKAVLFEDAIAPSSWTAPSIASLLTGLPPHDHGAIHSVGRPSIPARVVTYAEVLRNTYGYETAAFTDAPWLRNTERSMLQGFVRGSQPKGPLTQRSAERGFSFDRGPEILDHWLSKRDAARPFFLFLHTFEVHDPYGAENHRHQSTAQAFAAFDRRVKGFDASAIRSKEDMVRRFFVDVVARTRLFQDRGRAFVSAVTKFLYAGLREDPTAERLQLTQDVRAAYERGVGQADGAWARLDAYLQATGLLDNTLVVLTADHGEAFGEHGTLGHGQHLHRELTHVPLVMSGPAPFDKPRRVPQTVGLVDVMPTFFEWIDAEPPAGTQGASMLSLLRGANAASRTVLSETLVSTHMTHTGVNHLMASARSSQWFYCLRRELAQEGISESLFDLRADPEEQMDLAVGGRVLDMPAAIRAAAWDVRRAAGVEDNFPADAGR